MSGKKIPIKDITESAGYAGTGFKTPAQLAAALNARLDRETSPSKQTLPADLFPPPGVLPGTFSVLASLPSMGRTAFCINLALQLITKGKNVAIFLPDSTAESFLVRAAYTHNKINFSDFRRATPEELKKKLKLALDKLPATGLHIYPGTRPDSGTVTSKSSELQELLQANAQQLDAVIIDSLEHLGDCPFGEGKMKDLRDLARNRNLCVLGTWRLASCEENPTGQRSLADLRGAGLEERWTDAVWYLLRSEYFYREDPTLKNQATLQRLYPDVSLQNNYHYLKFSHETATFTCVQPLMMEPLSEEQVF
jgi:hypothetical protein